jgi:hypothetical protein
MSTLRNSRLFWAGAIAAGLVATASVWAEGTHGGNGGVVMVCREGGDDGTTRPIRRIELLDIYQANLREPFGMGIPVTRDKTRDPEAQIARALERLKDDPAFRIDVEFELARARARKVFLPEPPEVEVRKRLPLTGDFSGMVKDDGCHYEQLAEYRGEKDLLVDPELYRAITASPANYTDTAAFWLHEAVYKVLRNRWAASNSDKSRRIVALLFADKADPAQLRALTESTAPRTQAPYTYSTWLDPRAIPATGTFDVRLDEQPDWKNWKGNCKISASDSYDHPMVILAQIALNDAVPEGSASFPTDNIPTWKTAQIYFTCDFEMDGYRPAPKVGSYARVKLGDIVIFEGGLVRSSGLTDSHLGANLFTY